MAYKSCFLCEVAVEVQHEDYKNITRYMCIKERCGVYTLGKMAEFGLELDSKKKIEAQELVRFHAYSDSSSRIVIEGGKVKLKDLLR